jgi:hypothetical protein
MYVIIAPLCTACPGCLILVQLLGVPATDIALATWYVNADLFLYFNSFFFLDYFSLIWLLPVVCLVNHLLLILRFCGVLLLMFIMSWVSYTM